jgi:hypothetical protein
MKIGPLRSSRLQNFESARKNGANERMIKIGVVKTIIIA